tara:strand:+ start:346 stop:744 length:399 start_codon:yes stop_codon:yes gene_type:complete
MLSNPSNGLNTNAESFNPNNFSTNSNDITKPAGLDNPFLQNAGGVLSQSSFTFSGGPTSDSLSTFGSFGGSSATNGIGSNNNAPTFGSTPTFGSSTGFGGFGSASSFGSTTSTGVVKKEDDKKKEGEGETEK